jgi:hypothetical protein
MLLFMVVYLDQYAHECEFLGREAEGWCDRAGLESLFKEKERNRNGESR